MIWKVDNQDSQLVISTEPETRTVGCSHSGDRNFALNAIWDSFKSHIPESEQESMLEKLKVIVFDYQTEQNQPCETEKVAN